MNMPVVMDVTYRVNGQQRTAKISSTPERLPKYLAEQNPGKQITVENILRQQSNFVSRWCERCQCYHQRKRFANVSGVKA